MPTRSTHPAMAPIAIFRTRLIPMNATGRYLRARPHHTTCASAKYCIKWRFCFSQPVDKTTNGRSRCDGFCSMPSCSKCTNLQGGVLTLFSISCQNLNGNLLHNPALQVSTVNKSYHLSTPNSSFYKRRLNSGFIITIHHKFEQ